MNFLTELKNRNAVLYIFGWLYLAFGLFCATMTQFSDIIVLGINAWIKPMKFCFSIWLFMWTMGWYMHYLSNKRKVATYTWMVIIVMFIEQFIITYQAANGRLSHFNITSVFNRTLFIVMGIAITVLTAWTGVMGYYFFKQRQFTVPRHYIQGIRFGILVFVIFAFEGGIMATRLQHTVGAPDGSPGLPVFNWSREFGDLRVAHFIGIHALQLIPLFSFYVAKTTRAVQWFTVAYFGLILFLYIQAFRAHPFL